MDTSSLDYGHAVANMDCFRGKVGLYIYAALQEQVVPYLGHLRGKLVKTKKVKIIVQMFFMKESLITRSRIENVIRPYSTTHGNNIKAEKT